MTRAVLLLAVLCAGCASLTERIVQDARKGLAFDADYTPTPGGDPKVLAALYTHLTQELGIDVQYLPPEDPTMQTPFGQAFGVSWANGEALYIRVRQDLPVNATIQVLAHEAAHLYPPPYLTRPQGDVFAEIVSAHVSKRLGVPRAEQASALWLRQHRAWIRTALDFQNDIEAVADKLTPERY